MKKWITIGALLLSACSSTSENDISRAVAIITPTSGNAVSGQVSFTNTKEGVKVQAEIYHLMPGDHGFHIHEFGDISAHDGTATGGHYNPGSKNHGAPGAKECHVGDLGNITADSTGLGRYEQTFPEMKIKDIIGRSVIIHENADDLHSQPTGNAGPRVGQGAIGLAK